MPHDILLDYGVVAVPEADPVTAHAQRSVFPDDGIACDATSVAILQVDAEQDILEHIVTDFARISRDKYASVFLIEDPTRAADLEARENARGPQLDDRTLTLAIDDRPPLAEEDDRHVDDQLLPVMSGADPDRVAGACGGHCGGDG